MVVSAMAQGQYAQQGQSAPVPAGAGKELVESVCTGCHTTDQITRRSGYTREGWQERFQSWAIPSGGIYAGIVRHMRPTREGSRLIHQSSTNRIILVALKPPTTQ